MISLIIIICILFTDNNNSAFSTDILKPYQTLSKTTQCEPNRVYQKHDVTCFCNEYGRWPHRNCSLVFDQHLQNACKPNSYVQVDCNVCRCSKTGNIDKDFCTNHKCSADPQDKIIHRRFNNGKSKCEINHWYVISSCRLCFCITRENLLCAAQTHPKNLHLGKYNLTDCGPDWLSDINKLLSSVNPLRYGNKSEKHINTNAESVESQIMVQIHSTPSEDRINANHDAIIFNRENNDDGNIKIARNDDKSDNNDQESSESNSKSKSDEKIDEGKAIARIAGNTAMPFENDEGSDSNNSNEPETDRIGSDNESVSKKESQEVDITQEIESAIDINKNQPENVQTEIDQDSDESLLKINLPGVLAITEKVWSVRCKKNQHVLNDCNWCWCGQNYHFQCKARVCEEVDAFGHFKDTIQDLDVGMEGRGTWRSRPYSCTPGVQYQRGTILCICDEDGNWPNPVCRDLFRILHSVEVSENAEDSASHTCSPTKLYLVGCNTCFCPASGKLDANLCSNRTCSDGDPVLEPNSYDVDTKEVNTEPKDDSIESRDVYAESKKTDAEPLDDDKEPSDSIYSRIDDRKAKQEVEIYSRCNSHKIYTIGRQNCECLTSNRLTCKERDVNIIRGKKKDQYHKASVCGGKSGSVIKVKCNLCKCTSGGYMYCTTKKCISRNKDKHRSLSLAFRKVPKNAKTVQAPIDDLDCVPGTSYQRGCNKCFCVVENEKKILLCAIRPCRIPAQYDITRDCVSDTTYEIDCFICTCDFIDGAKHEACKISPRCLKTLVLKKRRYESLDSLHGYCEPRQVYKNGCNICICLSDGKIVKCTTSPCTTRSAEPVEVDIVPLQQAASESCPKGHSYKVECNLCFCLSNGNALCTTSDCSKQLK